MDMTDAVLGIHLSGSIWWAIWRDAGAVIGFLFTPPVQPPRFTCWMP
jgi:hypothetical protein